jgi:hypothetical protein
MPRPDHLGPARRPLDTSLGVLTTRPELILRFFNLCGPSRLSATSFFPFVKGDPMRVLVINNDGGGFADYQPLPESGLTVRQLFEQQVPRGKPESYLIRVNRLPAAEDQVLRDGDRISITPTKIEGASKPG